MTKNSWSDNSRIIHKADWYPAERRLLCILVWHPKSFCERTKGQVQGIGGFSFCVQTPDCTKEYQRVINASRKEPQKNGVQNWTFANACEVQTQGLGGLTAKMPDSQFTYLVVCGNTDTQKKKTKFSWWHFLLSWTFLKIEVLASWKFQLNRHPLLVLTKKDENKLLSFSDLAYGENCSA